MIIKSYCIIVTRYQLIIKNYKYSLAMDLIRPHALYVVIVNVYQLFRQWRTPSVAVVEFLLLPQSLNVTTYLLTGDG